MELIEQVRTVLYSYDIGTFLSDSDRELMMRVIERHPNAKEKIGSGIKNINVEHSGYGTRCFKIHRTDNSVIDFSFIKCFKKSPKDFPASARRAVEYQIREFRDTLPNSFMCPINGTFVTRKTAHIDHAPPMTFKQIVMLFEKPDSIEYDHSGIGVYFVDQELAHRFAEFHKKHATLRGISKEANLSLPRT